MAVTTNTAGAIAKASSTQIKSKKAPSTIKDYINLYSKEIAKALPSVLTPERFSRMAMTAITKTPKLAECSPQSFIGSLLTAAQLGLEPNTPLGQAYLIPFYNSRKRIYECQFQVGYKGMIDLCNRSGEIKNIEAHIVYENDEFEFEYGLDSKLKHKPCMSDKGAPVWVYALYRLNNGGYSFEVMSVDDCIAHSEKYSKAFNNSPWQTNPEEMMKKTVLKKVLKYAPVRSDFVKGTVADETIQVADFGDTEDGEINVIPVDVENSNEVEIDTETGEVKED